MSLTSLIRENDVRARFRGEFPTPPRAAPPPLLAPVVTKHPSIVGTAFDYLLRLRICRSNPGAIEPGWIATQALEKLPRRLKAVGRKQVLDARRRFDKYRIAGIVTPSLLRSAIDLARLDPVFRAGAGHEYVGAPHDALDLEDLRRLLDIVPLELLEPSTVAILNPTFGSASAAVGGADADLLLGDTLIEIKTTKDARVLRERFNQLVGYALLAELGGIDGAPKGHRIRFVAFYFSRHANLRRFAIRSIIPRERVLPLLRWLSRRAGKHLRDLNR